MVIVLGDLLADFSLRIPNISCQPGDLQQVTYLELGPGGASNVAIAAARFGLVVGCMGETGDDLFGRIVLDYLQREGIDTSNVVVTAGVRTPVAGVLVDDRGEPAYLGYPGSLKMVSVPRSWLQALQGAEAVFSDGWAEHDGMPNLILEAFRLAQKATIPIFFDPGPGNPQIDNSWHAEAAKLASAVMVTEEEAQRLTGLSDLVAAGEALLAGSTRLVAIKRGPAGCLMFAEQEIRTIAGFPVSLRDATGAGDSFDAAIIFGYLEGLGLESLGILANATGAAKVEKLGTGLNMPILAEIDAVLERFGYVRETLGLPTPANG